ncbi:MAG: hypothetical protein U0572_01360 [Phycisphaerales bacterium]
MTRALTAIGASCATLVLAGCTFPLAPTKDELAQIDAGDAVFVLARLECTIDDAPQEATLVSSWSSPLFQVQLGSFGTVGQPTLAPIRFASDESCHAGWFFLLLSPGVYYLAVTGPDTDAYATSDPTAIGSPQWRFDVPERARAVYLGTIRTRGRTTDTSLSGASIIAPANPAEIPIVDERNDALAIVRQCVPGADDVALVRLVRWYPGEPRVIRTPHVPSR